MFDNVDVKVQGKGLSITVPDTTKVCGLSDSGKNITVATTHGNVGVGNGLTVSVNVYKHNPNREKDVAKALARKAAEAEAK